MTTANYTKLMPDFWAKEQDNPIAWVIIGRSVIAAPGWHHGVLTSMLNHIWGCPRISGYFAGGVLFAWIRPTEDDFILLRAKFGPWQEVKWYYDD